MPTTVTDLNREHIEAYLVQLRERTSASTAATRYRGLRQMFKWLVAEGEINRNPFERMQPPMVEETPVRVITNAELSARQHEQILRGLPRGRTGPSFDLVDPCDSVALRRAGPWARHAAFQAL